MAEFVQARHYYRGRNRALRLIVWHDMEAPEKATTAEAVARYFATTDVKTSAHICVDSDSVVECVKPPDTAWAAPGANADGYHVELAGYARQSVEEWMDQFSRHTIENAARWVAELMRSYGIPAVWLSDAQLLEGRARGMVTHSQVSRVFKKSSHTDPGASFPYDYVKYRVERYINPANPPATPERKTRMLIRFSDSKSVYEVVGSHLEHVTGEAFKARGLTSSDVKVVEPGHALSKLPVK